MKSSKHIRKAALIYLMGILTVLPVVFLSGCYTFSQTTLPAYLKTIEVEPVVNQTLDPILAEELTQAIKKGFETNSTLRSVNENGNCRLSTVLKSYSHRDYNTSGSQVTDYRIDMVVQVKFYDQVKDKTLFEEDNLPGFSTYSINTMSEKDGQKMAVENIVKIILDNTISGW